MKKYQYILLDWDGNLAQTLDIWLECLKVSLERRGYSFSDKEIGADFAAFKARQQNNDTGAIDEILEEAVGLAAARVPEVGLYPDVAKTLNTLRHSGKKLALVTTSLHTVVDPLLKKHELEPLFCVVVCADDVVHVKPHAEPLLKALELLGGNKSDAVMIGDSEKDIEAAHNAGIDSILFYPSRHQLFYDLEELQRLHPTHIVRDFSEILDLM